MKRNIWISAVLALFLLLAGCAQQQAPAASPTPAVAATPAPTPTPVPEDTVAVLAVAGDTVGHNPLNQDAYDSASGRYDYTRLYADVQHHIEEADYAIVNLETTLSGGTPSGYPQFNSPDDWAVGLKNAGFDLASTANNHTRDRGYDGIFRTLDVLDQVGLAHVGTYRSQAERDENSGIVVADVGGISVAFLCYTYGLNGYTIAEDMDWCVNRFNLDYATDLSTPDTGLLQRDLAAAQALEPDLIAVIMHWGVEYQNQPNAYQQEMAEFLVANGADLVLGSHPHVIQRYETVTAAAPDGSERTGFVIYSLGNFVSNQYYDYTNMTIILKLTLRKDGATGQASLDRVEYVPCYMLQRRDLPRGQQYALLDVYDAMEEYEGGDSSRISPADYRGLQATLEHCHTIFGDEGDYRLEG